MKLGIKCAVVMVLGLLPFCVLHSSLTNRREPRPKDKTDAPASMIPNLHWFQGSYNRPFHIALPDRQTDHNTNVIMNNWYEDAIGDVFRAMLSGRCSPGSQVLDIGANLGIFAFTSAAFGCDVIAVEAQSRLIQYLNESVRINKWDYSASPSLPRVIIKNMAIADKPGSLKQWMRNQSLNAASWQGVKLKLCPWWRHTHSSTAI